jgi:hypothetical protein
LAAARCRESTVAPGNVAKTSLEALCPLNAGSNFGALFSGDYVFPGVAIYSRVETPSGNGFSIEGW